MSAGRHVTTATPNTASTAVSDASGMASAGGWTLGPTAGSQTLTAAASGLTGVSFTAAATAGGPAAITVVSGDNQQAAVGTPVGPIAVRVDDQYGNPVSGATVTLQVTSGGGQLAMSTALTNAQGVAAAGGWVLGTVPGPNTLTASISGGASRMFTATAIAGAAARLALTGGDAQSGDLGAPLATPLSVRVTDTYGNAVANVAVAFSVTSGSGQLAPVSASTNSQGSASTSLTLTGAGTTTVTASSGAIPGASVVFTASTGPTIVGSIVVAPDASRVQARMRSPAASIARPTRNATLKGGDLPVNESRRWLSEGAALIDTRGRLIVSFHKDAFSLPMDARAYGDASVRSQASAAFYAALQSFETEGLIRRREVSPAIAAVRVDVTPGIDAERVKRLLRQDPRVLDVEEDVVVSAHRVVAARPLFGWSGVPGWEAWTAGWHPAAAPPTELYPSDPLLADQLWHYRMIDLPRVWKVTTGSSAIRVAVVDAGVRPDHPGVAGLLAPSGHYDFTDGTTLAYAFPQPICGTILTFQTVRGTPADVAAASTAILSRYPANRGNAMPATRPTSVTVIPVSRSVVPILIQASLAWEPTVTCREQDASPFCCARQQIHARWPSHAPESSRNVREDVTQRSQAQMRNSAVVLVLLAGLGSCLPATARDFQMVQAMTEMGDAINEMRQLQYELQDRLDSLAIVVAGRDTVVRQLANLAGVPVPQ